LRVVVGGGPATGNCALMAVAVGLGMADISCKKIVSIVSIRAAHEDAYFMRFFISPCFIRTTERLERRMRETRETKNTWGQENQKTVEETDKAGEAE